MYQPILTLSTNQSSTEASLPMEGKAISSVHVERKTGISAHRLKLPLGAIVSPLSPFFNERAKNFAVEQAKASFMEEALRKLDESAENQQNRYRPRSQSSQSKDSEGGSSASSYGASSSTSNDSTDSSHSFATAISLMDDDQLPQSLPRISYQDWSKFGISLFTPQSVNPNSKMYYHYPSMEKSKSSIPSHVNGNRPRSKSSVTPSVSAHQSREERNTCSRPGITAPTSPLSRNPLVRRNSLRFRMERNHTSNY